MLQLLKSHTAFPTEQPGYATSANVVKKRDIRNYRL